MERADIALPLVLGEVAGQRRFTDSMLTQNFPVAAFATAVWALAGATAYAATFDAKPDADKTGECFSTYMTLAKGAAELTPSPESKVLDAQSAAGIKRMHRFVDASAAAVGEKAFYDHAYLSRLVVRHELANLAATPDSALMRDIIGRLATDASQCDRLLDTWGQPP